MRVKLAALALLVPILGALETSAVAAKPPLYETAGLAIAGVRLGMTPEQVSLTLRAAGYVREHQVANMSWEERVAREVAYARALPLRGTFRAVVWHETYRKGAERIEIYYQPMPSGPAVASVEYGLRNSAMTEEAFRASVRARYGAQSAGNSSEMIFCSVGETACNLLDFPEAKQLPNITAYPYGGAERSINLRLGAKAQREYEAAFKAELARRVPAMKRPTF